MLLYASVAKDYVVISLLCVDQESSSEEVLNSVIKASGALMTRKALPLSHWLAGEVVGPDSGRYKYRLLPLRPPSHTPFPGLSQGPPVGALYLCYNTIYTA